MPVWHYYTVVRTEPILFWVLRACLLSFMVFKKCNNMSKVLGNAS